MLRFHIVMWNLGLLRDNANPANIDIYSDGSVKDGRPFLNRYVRFAYGGEYD